jgi:hypothetical protein
VGDAQVTPQQCIEEYISNSSVGRDDDAPATRTGKRSTSRAAATIAATQMTEAKKKKQKRTGPVVLADTATVSFGIETINVDDEEDDAKSPKVATVPSAETPRKAASTEERAIETPCRTSAMEERPRSGADSLGDAGSHKRARKVPPKPCKLGLRSATK